MSAGVIIGLFNFTSIIMIVGVIMYSFYSMNTIEKDVSTLSHQSDKTFNELKEVDTKTINEIQTLQKNVVKDIAATKETIEKTQETKHQTLEKDINELQAEKLNDQWQSVTRKFDGVDNRFKTTESQIADNIGKVNTSINDLTNSTTNRFNTLTKKIDNTNNTFNTKYASLDNSFKTLSADLESSKNNIQASQIQMKKDILQAYTTDINNFKTDFNTKYKKIGDRFVNIESSNAKQEESIKVLTNTTSTFANTKTELEKRITMIENNLRDQIAYQMSMQTLLKDTVDKNSALAKEYYNQITATMTSITALQKNLQETKQTLTNFMNGYTTDISTIRNQIQTSQTDLNTLKTSINDQKSRIDALSTTQNKSIEDLKTQIATLAGQITNASKTTTQSAAVPITDAQLAQMQQDLITYQNQISTKINSTETTLTQMKTKVGQLETQLQGITTSNYPAMIANINTEIQALKATYDTKLSTYSGLITTQQKSIDVLNSQVADLNRKLSVSNTFDPSMVTKLQSQIDTLNKSMNDFNTRQSAQDALITALRTDVASTKTNLDNLTKNVANIASKDYSKGGTMEGGLIVNDSMQINKDLVLGGSNTYILHTPDDGRSSLHIAPKVGTNWDWNNQLELNKGKMTVPSIQTNSVSLGSKWKLSGTGDAHANDPWLRLMNAEGKNYYGGLAADQFYSRENTVTENLNIEKNITFKPGSTLNATGRLNISGGDTLHILNKHGAVISKDQGGTGDLSVSGKTNLAGPVVVNGTVSGAGIDQLKKDIAGTANNKLGGAFGSKVPVQISEHTWLPYTDGNAYIRPGMDKGNISIGDYATSSVNIGNDKSTINLIGDVNTYGAIKLNHNIAHPDNMDGTIYRADGQVNIATDDYVRFRDIRTKDTGVQIDTTKGVGDIKNPNGQLKLSRSGVMFGGNNNGTEENSGQISAGIHIPNSLNIVGMSTGKDVKTRRIDVWAEGGMNIQGNKLCLGPTCFVDNGNGLQIQRNGKVIGDFK